MQNNDVFLKRTEAIADINSSRSYLDQAKEYFNEVSANTFENIILFYNRLALISGAAISITFGFLPTLYEINGSMVNQYSLFFFIGIFFLIVCLVLGVFYRYVASRSSFFLALQNIAEKQKKAAKVEKKAVSDGLITPIKVTDYDKYIRDSESIAQKKAKMAGIFSFVSKFIEYVVPVIFTLGLTSMIIYFSAQIFDF